MERKLATAMFVDLVDSTALVAGSDPEVARRRVTGFFDRVKATSTPYGGTVEKFAGDAVLAVFGVPTAHEDDAERAVRAAVAILESGDGELPVRIGIEAGELVVEDGDSTFATGEAINFAARLQQAPSRARSSIGPTAHGLAAGIVTEPVGDRPLKGSQARSRSGASCARSDRRPSRQRRGAVRRARGGARAARQRVRARRPRPARAARDDLRRPRDRQEPSRAGVLRGARAHDRAHRPVPPVRRGHLLPAAGRDGAGGGRHLADDSPEEAIEKLSEACTSDAVADLLGLASGVLDTVSGGRRGQEIAWAAHEWATNLAEAQPLVLGFDDLHWAEEPLLDLVEHLADRIDDAPVLIVCLARPELLDARPAGAEDGGGRSRSSSARSPRARPEARRRALRGRSLPEGLRTALLDKTEGNPLFVEETVRMLVEQGDGAAVRIPDTVQALIAARIDRLPPDSRSVLRHGALVGRVFWRGAIAELDPELDVDVGARRPRRPRSCSRGSRSRRISGEDAYRFRHVLIRDVAYGGLAKGVRARLHRAFAAWLRARRPTSSSRRRRSTSTAPRRCSPSSRGRCPPSCGRGRRCARAGGPPRARARGEPHGATAAAALDRARAEPDAPLLRGAGGVAVVGAPRRLRRDGGGSRAGAGGRRPDDRGPRARRSSRRSCSTGTRTSSPRASSAREALELLADAPGDARYEALTLLSSVGWWEGDLTSVERYTSDALEIAREAGRADLESLALVEIAAVHLQRLELAKAEEILAAAAALAESSGSLSADAWASRIRGSILLRRGRFDEAAQAFRDGARAVRRDRRGVRRGADAAARRRRRLAERRARARRADRPRGRRALLSAQERAKIVEAQRTLAEIVLAQGHVEEAERWALSAVETVGMQDMMSRSNVRMVLGLVRAAQGRDDEAELLLREAIDILAETEYRNVEPEPLAALARFLRERGRDDEAAAIEDRLDELLQPESAARII